MSNINIELGLALTEKYFCIYYVYFSRYIQWLSSRQNNIFSVLALEMWWDFFSWTVLLNLPALLPSLPPPQKNKKFPISARSKQPMKRFTHLVNLMLRHRKKDPILEQEKVVCSRKIGLKVLKISILWPVNSIFKDMMFCNSNAWNSLFGAFLI